VESATPCHDNHATPICDLATTPPSRLVPALEDAGVPAAPDRFVRRPDASSRVSPPTALLRVAAWWPPYLPGGAFGL
jgi:hypothetical protein